MDGSGRMALHTTNLNTPYALAIDYATQTLYWADYALNILESSQTDGSNRRLLNLNLRDPYAMTFFAGKLYWTDWSYNGIYSTLSNSPTSITSLLFLNTDPYDIHVFDEDVQFEGSLHYSHAFFSNDCYYFCVAANPCANNNGNCSQLCLLSATAPAGYSCACNDDYILTQNQTHCERK